MLGKHDLHGYQRRAIDFILDKKRVFLTIDMGLGKTVLTLTALSDLFDAGIIRKVLVIAPLKVAKNVWAQEALNWEHLQHLQFSICTGNEENRIAAFRYQSQIYVINRENIPWLIAKSKDKWPFDAIVIDESSSFKSASSKRFKLLKRMAFVSPFLIELTGTPMPNSYLDLWSQCFLIDRGDALGQNMWHYKNKFFTPDHWGYSWDLKPAASKEIQKLIGSFTLSLRGEDYLELPEKINLIHWVSLTPKILAQYRQFERDLLMDLPRDGGLLVAENAAILANKLLQFCSGCTYDENRKTHIIHDEKIEALSEIVEDLQENALIVYNFKHDLVRIQQRFKDARILDNNPKTIEDWNEGKIKLLLAQPASCGEGLNLQKGGSLIIWYGLNWSLGLYQQLNARLHRQGQTKPVRIIHIMTRGTYDERVMKRLLEKDVSQRDLIDALR
jgi:SNF2 family DNA or RNA helicase